MTSFGGRVRELVYIGAALRDARLVPLTGVGGVGTAGSIGIPPVFSESAQVWQPRVAWFPPTAVLAAHDPDQDIRPRSPAPSAGRWAGLAKSR